MVLTLEMTLPFIPFKFMYKMSAVTALAILFASSGAAGQIKFTYTHIPVVLEDEEPVITGFNNRGQIVGYWGEGNNGFVDIIGQPGSVSGPPGGVSFIGDGEVTTGISDSGQVVGHMLVVTPLPVTVEGFSRSIDGSSYSTGPIGTQYNAISADGTQIVGSGCGPFNSPSWPYGDCRSGTSFLLHNGKSTSINVPDATSTIADAVTNDGEILGDSSRGQFLYRDGRYTMTDGSIYDINNRGQMIGTFGFRDTDGTISPDNGAILMNDRDQLLGYDSQGLFVGNPVAVTPEPSFYGILTIGLAGLLLARGWNRYRNQSRG